MAATPNELALVMIDVKDRLAAMQEIIVPNSEAFTYPSGQQTGGIYWTTRIGANPAPVPAGTGNYEFALAAIMILHLGFATEDYDGVLEDELMWTHIPNVLQFFLERPLLVYEAGQEPPLYFGPKKLTISQSGFQEQRMSFGTLMGCRFDLGLSIKIVIEEQI